MSTRRGFFGSIFGGIAAAICPRSAPTALSQEELREQEELHAQYVSLVEQYRASRDEYRGFVFVADSEPTCFVAENGNLVRVYPGKEPS